jgi:hypothetical protein
MSNYLRRIFDPAGARRVNERQLAEQRERERPMREAEEARQRLQQQQLGVADAFSKNLGANIEAETSLARRALQNQLGQQQKGLRSQMSGRGLLFSGRRLKGEGELAGGASQSLAEARQNIMRQMMGTEQALRQKAVGSASDFESTQQQHNAALQGIRNQYNQAMQQNFNQMLGNIGSGVGTYFANRQPSSPQPTSVSQQIFMPGQMYPKPF